MNTPQGLATDWLINHDGLNLCADNAALVQRWALAVFYFSTNGNNWFRCSASEAATDSCGTEDPFVGSARFLSDVNECDWAGISCYANNLSVRRIDFQQNNLEGTIPTEVGLFSDLIHLGLSGGALSGLVPIEIGKLHNLTFINLSFNDLTGTLPMELFTLSGLEQLYLNDNILSGSIAGIGALPGLILLQVQSNDFTGQVPESLGKDTNLATLTLYRTSLKGTMPTSICDLVDSGVMTTLIADCSGPSPEIICGCCTDCRWRKHNGAK